VSEISHNQQRVDIGRIYLGKNNATNIGTIRHIPQAVARAPLSADPHSSPVPTFQQFLDLTMTRFKSARQSDTTKADINAGRPPLGFLTYKATSRLTTPLRVQALPTFGLLYVTGDLTINGNQTLRISLVMQPQGRRQP